MISSESKLPEVSCKTLAGTVPASRPQLVMGESQQAFKKPWIITMPGSGI